MSQAAHDGHHPDEQHNRAVEHGEAETAQQVAAAEQHAQGMDPTEFLTEEFTGTVTELDIDRELPNSDPAQHNIGRKLGAHTSKQLALGQITREKWEYEELMDKARRHLIQMGYRRRGGTGSECTGRTRELMTGGDADPQPQLTDDLDDQLDAGMEAKTMLRSGSINGRTFRGITEAHVVTRSEGYKRDTSDGGGGRLSKVTSFFLGG